MCVCCCYSEQCLEARQVVWTTGNEVVIRDKDDTVHRFGYDHCFSWSPDSKSDEQECVYRSLAKPLLDRSFEGYNTCLFAYGQVSTQAVQCQSPLLNGCHGCIFAENGGIG